MLVKRGVEAVEFCASARRREHIDRLAGGAGFARHIYRICRNDEQIGVGQKIRIGVFTAAEPQNARWYWQL